MSMINDALRRARNASRSASDTPSANAQAPVALPPSLPSSEEQYEAPPRTFVPDASMPPELSDDELQDRSSKKHILIAMLFLFCIGSAIGFGMWKRKAGSKIEKAVATIATKAIVPDANVRRASSNAVEAALAQVATKPAPAPASVAQTVPQPPTVVAAPVAPPVPVKFPALRLQSIFYRPSNPSVLINGKTLYVTDEIQGVLVADIQPASVTLVLSGQTNILTLR